MHYSPNLSPTTSRCPNEDELEGKSDTGLSPPNYNVTARTTPPIRDSESLSSDRCLTVSNMKEQSRQKPELSLSLPCQTRLKTILPYLDPALYSRSYKIGALLLS